MNSEKQIKKIPSRLLVAAFLSLAAAPFFVQAASYGGYQEQAAYVSKAYGVTVYFEYSREAFFPEQWRKKPGLYYGEPVAARQRDRGAFLVEKFLDAYPSDIIEDNLSGVYLLGRIQAMGHEIAGTYYGKGIYAVVSPHVSDRNILSTLHHEFSSVLMRSHAFPVREWLAANPRGWKYAGGSRLMIEKGAAANSNLAMPSHSLLKKGFLTPYGQSSIEDDFNIYASWLFTRYEDLKQLADEYPGVRRKMNLAAGFFKTVSPEFEFSDH